MKLEDEFDLKTMSNKGAIFDNSSKFECCVRNQFAERDQRIRNFRATLNSLKPRLKFNTIIANLIADGDMMHRSKTHHPMTHGSFDALVKVPSPHDTWLM